MNALANEEGIDDRSTTLYLKALCRWIVAAEAPGQLEPAIDYASSLHTLIGLAEKRLGKLKQKFREEAATLGARTVELRGVETAALVVFPATSLHPVDMLTHSELPPDAARLFVRESHYVPISTWRRVFDGYPAKVQKQLQKAAIWTLPTPQVSFKP